MASFHEKTGDMDWNQIRSSGEALSLEWLTETLEGTYGPELNAGMTQAPLMEVADGDSCAYGALAE